MAGIIHPLVEVKVKLVLHLNINLKKCRGIALPTCVCVCVSVPACVSDRSLQAERIMTSLIKRESLLFWLLISPLPDLSNYAL